jgi:RNA polymerase sigma factor (sigma-70 family)
MARLRAADPDAASEVFHRFAARLTALARSKLDERLRAKVDTDDVLQSVYRTFFRRHAGGQFGLEGWDDLWALLALITVRKCGDWREHFRAAARDVRAEVAGADRGVAAEALGVLARDPTPSEATALADEVEMLLSGLSPRDRGVVALRLEGYTPAETAERLGLPQRTVFRVLERVKKRLQRLRDEDNGTR